MEAYMSTRPKWTVLVYMAADTSDSFYRIAVADVGEMMEARFPEEVKVIVHADAPSPWKGQCWRVKGASQGNGGHGATPKGNACVSKDCHHNGVLDFVKQSIEESDSEYYLLVLWGHGEGIDWKQKVIGPNVQTAAVNKRFALGSQNALEVGDLATALSGLELKNIKGAKLKRDDVVVGFDACLMGMVEVYNEIKQHVGWGFGTSDEIPVAGWPYKEILNLLGKNQKIGPPELTRCLVETCATWYSDNSAETKIGFAGCDLSHSDSVLREMKELTAQLAEGINDQKVWQAVRDARSFAEDLQEVAYVDLFAFCYELASRLGQKSSLSGAANNVSNALGKFILKSDFSNSYPKAYAEHSRSLSICFPESAERIGSTPNLEVNWESYEKLRFSESTSWPTFLRKYWYIQRSGDRRAKAAG
jgi:hypothetical protein